MTLPLLLSRFFPSGVLGLELTTLVASFISGMAGLVQLFVYSLTIAEQKGSWLTSKPVYKFQSGMGQAPGIATMA